MLPLESETNTLARFPRPAPLASLLAAAGIFVLCGLGMQALLREQPESERLVAEKVTEGHYRLHASVLAHDSDPRSQLRLLVDSGNLAATVSCRLSYDLDGDGTIDRQDPAVTFRTDTQAGYQEIDRTVTPGVWKRGRVNLDVETQPPVELAFSPDCQFRP